MVSRGTPCISSLRDSCRVPQPIAFFAKAGGVQSSHPSRTRRPSLLVCLGDASAISKHVSCTLSLSAAISERRYLGRCMHATRFFRRSNAYDAGTGFMWLDT